MTPRPRSFPGSWLRAALALGLGAAGPSLAAEALRWSCPPPPSQGGDGCLTAAGTATANLLLRDTPTTGVVLRWETSADPTEGGQKVLTVYAGDPAEQDTLPDRGTLRFSLDKERGVYVANQPVAARDLGGETFLVVITGHLAGEQPRPDGANEHIIEWRAFRARTAEQLKQQRTPPAPPSGRTVTVRPWLIAVDTRHGKLPRREGTPGFVWAVQSEEGRSMDQDLDGESTGAAGLDVHVADPWTLPDAQDWRAKAEEVLGLEAPQKVRFGDLEILADPAHEQKLRDLQGKVQGTLIHRSYYTVITLRTSATVAPLRRKDTLDAPSFLPPDRYFAHETTAQLRPPNDPRLWSSYSVHEYGRDRRLLMMLARQVERGDLPPGLVGVQREDGDGGDVTYSVGFYAQVRPWVPEQDAGTSAFLAGIVAADVIAARSGIGGVRTGEDGGPTGLQAVVCQVIGCDQQGGKTFNLADPPRGFVVYSPAVTLRTLSSSLALLDDQPELAFRELPPFDPAKIPFPAAARFGIDAKLRAGALAQTNWRKQATTFTPIDAHAQFVVKLTVAMIPQINRVDPTTLPIPNKNEFEVRPGITVKPAPFWKKYLGELVLGAIGVGLVLFAIFVPGALGLLRATLAIPVKLLRKLVDAINRRLDAK